MADALIALLQLIGALTAVGLVTAAVVGYLVVWPTEALFGRWPGYLGNGD